jgi:DnaJ domain
MQPCELEWVMALIASALAWGVIGLGATIVSWVGCCSFLDLLGSTWGLEAQPAASHGRARPRQGRRQPTSDRWTVEDTPSWPGAFDGDDLAWTYRVLGVDEGASESEVRLAYHQLAQTYHPDKWAAMDAEFQAAANHKMAEINASYELLMSELRTKVA